VHGGPGGGTNGKYRRFFDPAKYRIIIFDQRGCGKSTPHACLEDNTTWSLIGDMEKLRRELGVDRWQVFGGSWGSTLGLSYAIMHPDRVTELVMRGIFMLRKKELEWYYQEGASNIYPDRWEGYRDAIDPLKRGNFMKAYVERMGGKDGKAIGRRWRGDGEEMRRRRRHLVEKRQRSRASKRE
jgi:proline iminopeptidase